MLPFTDILFKKARNARDTNRKILQAIPEKRKVSSKALKSRRTTVNKRPLRGLVIMSSLLRQKKALV
jgi:hypothetical protein